MRKSTGCSGPTSMRRPTYQQVTQLTYITQILKEALRLWPPAPAYGIAPLKDETIGGKYKLKKNTFVTVLVMALHRDPSVWGPNPDAFDPENFSREAEAKRPVNAWKPFGNGQRACIGRGFAMHEAALAIGMILQRFKLIDNHRYQMQLKETLTIKPDGFKIKVRPRADKDRGAFAGRAAVAAAASNAAAPQARTRPGHNTPLLVLYGSNLGTAEELATRVADLAEVNGFATKLGALDDYVGKLPEQGGVLIFCASYNGAPPDNATQFVKWLGGDLPKDAFAKVRYAVFGCGNSDWAATYQSVPRLIDEQLAAHGARSVYARGEGDARSDLDGQFENWFAAAAPAAMKEFGVDSSFTRSADDAPLYTIEPVAPTAVNAIVALGGVAPMKVLVNSELQNKTGANPSDRSTRHIEVQLPPGITYRVGDHLSVVPRNDPALVDSVARRFGFLPADQIRLQVAEGRRAQLPVGDAVSVGRLLTEFVELQQVATRKQIQIMSEHTRCPVTKPKLLAYVGDDDASTERYRAEVLGRRKSVFDLLEEYPACELPFHAYLEMLSLLAPRYYSISSSPSVDPARCSVTVGVVEAPASSGRGVYKGVCSNYLAGRRVGDTVHATVRETKAGFRLPDDAVRADHHDRPGNRAGAVPRLPAGARAPQGAGRQARPGDAVLRLPPSRPGFSLCRRAEGLRRRRHHRTAHRVLARRRAEDLCAASGRGAEGPRLEPDRAGRDHLRLRRRRQDGAGRQGRAGGDLSRADGRRRRSGAALDRRSRHEEPLRARRLGGRVDSLSSPRTRGPSSRERVVENGS